MTDTTEDATITRGHNNPPDGILPILPPTEADEEKRAEALAAAKAKIGEEEAPAYDLKVWADLEASVLLFCDAAGAWDRIGALQSLEQSERLTDFVTGSRDLWKKADAARKTAKAPWDAGATKVQEAYSPLLTKLETVAKKMKLKQADWLKREQDRIDAEKAAKKAEADRLAAEALKLAREAEARGDISGQVDAAAALKDAEKAQKVASRETRARASTATGGGRTMALRTTRTARIDNIRACFIQFQNHPAVVEALTRAANEAIRSGFTEDQAKLAGFAIIETQGAA